MAHRTGIQCVADIFQVVRISINEELTFVTMRALELEDAVKLGSFGEHSPAKVPNCRSLLCYALQRDRVDIIVRIPVVISFDQAL